MAATEERELNEIKIVSVTTNEEEKNAKYNNFELEYPKTIGIWWKLDNMIRICCWLSFWLSMFYFTDSLKISGHLLYPNKFNSDVRSDLKEKNPACTVMFVIIYFLVSFGLQCLFFITHDFY